MKQRNKMRLGAAVCSLLVASMTGGNARGEIAELGEARIASVSVANGTDAPAQMPAVSAEAQAAREAYEQVTSAALRRLVEAGILSQTEADAFVTRDARGPQARQLQDGDPQGARGQGQQGGMDRGQLPQGGGDLQGQSPQGEFGRDGAPSGNSPGGRASAWSGLMTQEKLAALTAEQQVIWAEVEQQLNDAETVMMEAMQGLVPAS